MPATIRPSNHSSVAWEDRDPYSKLTRVASPEQLLSLTTADETGFRGKYGGKTEKAKPTLIQSSFTNLDIESNTFASKNSLVFACIEAYSEHHNLVIRPDDVWTAILAQLGSYINANAEDLRHLFVDHEGRKRLHIEVELDGVDHGQMAFQMTKLMGGSVRDPSLRDWVLPSFSTTEKNDQAVASIVFMGAMQKYFIYSWGTRCGIPSVTLLGDADDWVAIRQRCADRLGSGGFGSGPQRWYRVLRPVLDGFVESFCNPGGQDALSFWRGILDRHQPNGSGTLTYSGWLTAFCYWDEQGSCLHESTDGSSSSEPRLSRSQVPMGFSKVPVTLFKEGTVIPTEMIAGSVAIRVRDSVTAAAGGEPQEGSSDKRKMKKPRQGRLDTVQPELGWFMYKT